jgi:hypothetical protein
MGRIADIALLVALAAVGSRGQTPVQPHSPQEPDPHENSVEQNAPSGDRDSPAEEPPSSLRIPDEIKPAKSPASKPQVVKPLPSTDSEDAILGRWELVPEKSHFAADAMPRREVRTYVKTSEGIQATVISTQADGTVRSMSYPWRVDGKEYPVKGSPLLDSIILKSIDNLTAEATLKHGDTVLASERREFSADGKTMSITVQDMTSEHPVSSKAVYRKVGSKPPSE